jgi:hypothetical protein
MCAASEMSKSIFSPLPKYQIHVLNCAYGRGCLIRINDVKHDLTFNHGKDDILPRCDSNNCPYYIKAYLYAHSYQDYSQDEIYQCSRHNGMRYHPPLVMNRAENIHKLATAGGSDRRFSIADIKRPGSAVETSPTHKKQEHKESVDKEFLNILDQKLKAITIPHLDIPSTRRHSERDFTPMRGSGQSGNVTPTSNHGSGNNTPTGSGNGSGEKTSPKSTSIFSKLTGSKPNSARSVLEDDIEILKKDNANIHLELREIKEMLKLLVVRTTGSS